MRVEAADAAGHEVEEALDAVSRGQRPGVVAHGLNQHGGKGHEAGHL